MSPLNTVLIIDDSAFMNLAASRVLRGDGFRTSVAHTAKQARAHLERAKPDVILMDVQMPDVDGYVLTREFKANASTSAIPIVIWTGRSLAVDREMAFNAGCDEFIVKPINPQTLGRILRDVIEQATQHDTHSGSHPTP